MKAAAPVHGVDVHKLAAAWMARCRWAPRDATALDEMWAAALHAIGEAAATWRPEGGRSFASWAWVYMDGRVAREMARSERWRAELVETPPDVSDGEWLHPALIDPGYDRVDAADVVRRVVAWARLTPHEADAVAHFATFGKLDGSEARQADRLGLRSRAGTGLCNARRKLRAAARAQEEHWRFKTAEAA